MDHQCRERSTTSQPCAVALAAAGSIELESEKRHGRTGRTQGFNLPSFDEMVLSLLQGVFARRLDQQALDVFFTRRVCLKSQILEESRTVPEQLERRGERLKSLSEGFRRRRRLEALAPGAGVLGRQSRLQKADQELSQSAVEIGTDRSEAGEGVSFLGVGDLPGRDHLHDTASTA